MTDSSSSSSLLQELFDQVVARISGTSSSATSTIAVGTNTKLRLYGLYKHCTIGPYDGNGGGWFNPTELAKQRAWQACENMDRNDAMMEYVQLAASLDSISQQYLDQYNHTAKNTEKMKSDDDDEKKDVSQQEQQKSQQQQEDQPTTLDSTKSTETLRHDRNSTIEIKQQVLPKSSSNKTQRDNTQTKNSSGTSGGWWQWQLRLLMELFLAYVPPPIIPRGALDIAWADLWFAIWACITAWITRRGVRQQQEEEYHTAIGNLCLSLWNSTSSSSTAENDNPNTTTQPLPNQQQQQVVVGYTVRSLLDLYLTQKQYPPHHHHRKQQQVIVVPPITIPGMVQLLQHYGLQVVAAGTSPTRIDLDAIRNAIRPNQTVAIMVVHTFGTVTATLQEMLELRQLANQYQVELWEDAAESYQGDSTTTTMTSPASSCGVADLTLISFGLIKTATACGGGIALVRNAQDATAMRRIQKHQYQPQSIREYFQNKVLQAVLVHTISQSPTLYGWFVWTMLKMGGYAFLDGMITRNVRSIVPTTSTSSSTTNNNIAWLRTLRKRPCLPLLQMLHRRLQQSTCTARTVARRVNQCQEMTRLLQQYAPSVQVPVLEEGQRSTYWLYPIQIDHKIKPQVQQRLLRAGWDVASGISQLKCVQGSSLPVQEFMNNVLYLPVASRSLTCAQCTELAQQIQAAIDVTTTDNDTQKEENYPKKKNRHAGVSAAITWLPVLLLVSVFSGNVYFLRILVWKLLPNCLALACYGLVVMVSIGYGLQWLAGSIYLQSSTSFAKYNSMIDVMAGETGASIKESKATNPHKKTNDTNAGVMACMPSLQLPTASKGDDSHYQGCAILTGSTGFIGSLLLRDLLLHRKALNLTYGVFVLCRPKRNLTAHERILNLLQQDMFSFLSESEKQALVHVVEGDVTQPNAGLSDDDWNRLLSLASQNVAVTKVIHSAASVSFTQTLAGACQSNITAALTIQALTGRLGAALREHEACKNFPMPKYIHLSTAFVHGSHAGSEQRPLPQTLFSLEPYISTKLYESMLGTQFYASKAMNDLRFHNTYAFTKCVCEHILLQRQRQNNIPTMIIRPSIVGPALSNPHEGWAGSKPTTIVAAGCLYLSYQWNLWCFGKYDVPCIPVDVVSRFVLAKAFDSTNNVVQTGASIVEDASTDSSYDKVNLESLCSTSNDDKSSPGSSVSESRIGGNSEGEIYTAAWDSSSSDNAMFTWHDYCGATLQLGAVMGYFTRATAFVGLWVTSRLMPRLQLSFDTYERIHHGLILVPVQWFLALCRMFGWSKMHKDVSKLSAFLDLPLLFFPYMNEKFYFHSDLVAPLTMNGPRYAFSSMVAAHRFVTSIKTRMKNKDLSAGRTDDISPGASCYVIGGKQHKSSTSLWWAMTQPNGSFIVRLAGWFFAKILRATCYAVSVDLASFEDAVKARLAERDNDDGKEIYLVMTPTHRSFFDFILLSYLSFSIPELHIDLPTIAAAEDFESLPVIGWLAQNLGAFYLRRGRGMVDPELKAKLTSVKQLGTSVFEVFLEGTRSRDRRFREPKTGLLRSLTETGGSYLVLPIAISYEKLPEQDILAVEAAGTGKRSNLSIKGLLSWLQNVVKGRVCLGSIHISAGNAVMLECNSSIDYLHFTKNIQMQQRQLLHASDYHVEATARLLQLEPAVIRDVMTLLGCKLWPAEYSYHPTVPHATADNLSELCTIMLQFGPQLSLALQLASTKSVVPSWHGWFDQDTALGESAMAEGLLDSKSIQSLLEALSSILSSAETRVEKAKTKLGSSGFEKPTLEHLLQAASMEFGDIAVPGVLLKAAASFHVHGDGDDGTRETLSVDANLSPALGIIPQPMTDNEEALGFWGYRDSGFTLQVDKTGSQYVTMRGNRYSLSGKPLRKLLPFVEHETQIAVDPFKEAFQSFHSASTGPADRPFSEAALQELLSTVDKISLLYSDRARHNFGHCQEDIYALRTASPIRIPDAVVWPSTEAQVTDLIALAKRQDWCLIPFGGGTNVTQATRCPSKEIEPRLIISVDMRKLNRILWLNEEDGVACVEAGITGRELASALEERGYTMGHEPDSIEFSTLGGWIATKASGMKQNKYGNIEDIVKDVRVAGPSGLLWQQGKGCQNSSASTFGRQSTGMDLRSLLIGSEGCLGIVTSAVVKIWPLPEAKEFDGVLFSSFELGLCFVRDVAKLGRTIPASVRLLDNEHFRLGQALQSDASSVKEHVLKLLQSIVAAWNKDTLGAKSVVCATISYEGSKIDVAQQKSAIHHLAKQYAGLQLGARAGKAGYDLTFMIAYLRDFAMTYHFLGESFETFVPWSKVELVIQKTKERIRKEHQSRCLPGVPFIGCRVTQLYHEGACLYFYFCMNTENVSNASQVFSDIEHAARSEILSGGGSLSHHHGVGKVRADFLKETSTSAFQTIVADVKRSMDPDNIFGAGNGLFARDSP